MSTSQHHDMTDSEWERIRFLIPEPPRRRDGRGRPWRGSRTVLDGILYVLRTESAWAALPDCYPPYQTCHRRFQQWSRAGVMYRVLNALAEESSEQTARRVHLEPWVEDPIEALWAGKGSLLE